MWNSWRMARCWCPTTSTARSIASPMERRGSPAVDVTVRSLMRCTGFAVLLLCAVDRPLLADTFGDRVAPCLACHGEKGYSEHPAVPSLGGQPAPYLLIQLYLFRENQRSALYRRDDQMIQVMTEMTKGFSDDDLRTFSDFL